MGAKKYTTIISILFIILLMSANKHNNEIFPGLVPAPAYIEFLDTNLLRAFEVVLSKKPNKYIEKSIPSFKSSFHNNPFLYTD